MRFADARLLPAPFAAIAVALALTACGGDAPEESPDTGTVPDLATVEVGARIAPAELRVEGVVEAVDQAVLSAQTAGRVAATPVDVGDAVTSGQVVLRLRAAEQQAGLGQAQAALDAARARDAQARSQFDRIADMYQRKVVARATYDEALAARDGAAAALAAARAALESAREGVAYTELRAPYDGVVTARNVQVGEAVAPGMPLVTIAARGALRVVANVPQAESARVRGLQQATVLVDDRRIESTRLTVFPAADASSGTFRVRVDLPDPTPGLAPGMHAKVGFAAGESSLATVPRTAVVERSELRAVYVVTEDGRVLLRQVRLGRTVGDEIEVIAGLARGERVATEPASAALQARRAGPPAAGHE